MTKRFISLLFALALPAVSVQAQESFNAPKSDVGMEMLIDLIASVSNLDLQKLLTPRILSDEIVVDGVDFESRKIEMRAGDLGRVTLHVKIPKGVSAAPAVILLPGLNTQADLLEQFDSSEKYVRVMVEYPFPQAATRAKRIQQAIVKAFELQLKTVTVFNWVKNLDYVDETRISVVSVSYGTFLAPFALRVAQTQGFDPYALVFAYGGADLKSIILPELEKAMSSADFDHIQKPLNQFFKWTSPSQHLPHLNTQTGYLVLSGAKDEVIPSESSKVLYERLPDPKESVKLDSGHIGINRPETVKMAFDSIHDWLKKQGAF